MRVRILLVLLVGAAAASGCSPRTPGSAGPSGNRVDLSSADGILFLQSPQTGFIEAPPAPRTRTAAPTRTAAAPRANDRGAGGGSLFSKKRLWGEAAGGDGGNGGAARNPALAAHGAPPAAAARRGPDGRSPHITVRPAKLVAEGPPQRASRTLSNALEATYDRNPEINRARADLRATDESIAIARSGNRPRVTASLSTGVETTRDENLGGVAGANRNDNNTPTRVALTVSQPLFDGFRTRNATRQAEASVRAGREQLRGTRQTVLFDAIAAFLDVRLNRELVRLAEADIRFLRQQVEDSRSRLEFGEGTLTDVNQAEARLAEARSALAATRADLDAAKATFRRVTGLAPARFDLDLDVERLIPETLTEAVARGQRDNPLILRAEHEADAANFNVKQNEGELLPGVSLEGQVGTTLDDGQAGRRDSASVSLNVEIPLYQGGLASAQVRQAKEQLGSARIAIDLARDQVRDEVVRAWTRYRAELEAIRAARAGIVAARSAVEGVLEEQAVGQRTTLDVLNTQRDLVQAQVTLARARRNRQLAAFALLRAIGALDVETLGIPAEIYDPREHTAAVRDKWFGLRTPDGR